MSPASCVSSRLDLRPDPFKVTRPVRPAGPVPGPHPGGTALGRGLTVVLWLAVLSAAAPPVRADNPTRALISAPSADPRDGPARVVDPSANPLLDRHYARPERLPPTAVDPFRAVHAHRFRIPAAAGIRPGMRIADFSVGQGLITALFARAVGPEGRVYGVGSDPGLPDILQGLSRQYRVGNLIPIASTGEDAALPAEGIDLAFLAGGLDQFTDPSALLAAIHRALIPYGTLVAIAPHQDARRTATASDRAPGPEDLVRLARQAGFRLLEESDFIPDHRFMRFEREAEGAADTRVQDDGPRPQQAPPAARDRPPDRATTSP